MQCSDTHLRRLITDLYWALDHQLPERDLRAMASKLAQAAPPRSQEACFAKYTLAELCLNDDPWKSARLAQELIADGAGYTAWGMLGLAHSVAGHYKSALRAYWEAYRLEPNCPRLAHNLGHLLDAKFGRTEDALRLLKKARLGCPNDAEVAASYALALGRAGQRRQAEQVLVESCGLDGPEARDRLDEWLVRAPPAPDGRPVVVEDHEASAAASDGD